MPRGAVRGPCIGTTAGPGRGARTTVARSEGVGGGRRRGGIQKYERDDRHGESKDQGERGCFQQATARDVPGPETVFLTVPKTDRRPAPREQGGGDALGRLGLTRNERALKRSCYRHNSVTHGNADLKTGCVNE